MLLDRKNLRPHLPWIVFAGALLAGCSAWFATAARGQATFPSGSSVTGLTFGVLGGLIILFEFALWPRKQVRAWRLGRAQTWMAAHIWLGLISLPVILLHSGFRFGGNFTTVLTVILILVVVSGVWGLILQNLLPRKMLDEIPAETIYGQIDHVCGQLGSEAERLVEATCGPAGDGAELLFAADDAAEASARVLVVGAVRSAGKVQGKVVQTRAPGAPVPDSEPLRVFFRETLAPYLRAGKKVNSPLQVAGRAAVLFDDLRTRLHPAAHETVNALQGICDQRRQFDQQKRLHFWLHNWLWIHLPLSLALVVLMVLHTITALKYW